MDKLLIIIISECCQGGVATNQPRASVWCGIAGICNLFEDVEVVKFCSTSNNLSPIISDLVPCNRHLSLTQMQIANQLSQSMRFSGRRTSIRSRNSMVSTDSGTYGSDLHVHEEAVDDLLVYGDEDNKELWEDWSDEDFFEDNEDCEDCKDRAKQLMLQNSLPPQVTAGRFGVQIHSFLCFVVCFFFISHNSNFP